VRDLMSEQLALAAVNGDEDCVVAGDAKAVDEFELLLEGRGAMSRRLDIGFAFHSASMDQVLAPFSAYVEAVDLDAPRVPFASTLTGTWVDADELRDPAYWSRQLRQTVRCADALQTLQTNEHLLIEVGPGETLAGLARRRRTGLPVLSTLGRPSDTPERARLLGALGQLWCNGVAIDWDTLQTGDRPRRVNLPTYPFARTRVTPSARRTNASQTPRRDAADWLYRPTWQASPASARAPLTTSSSLVFGDGDLASARAVALGPGTTMVGGAAGYAQRTEDRHELDPTRREHYDALFSDLDRLGRLPDRIVVAWCLDDGAAACSDHVERPFAALLALVQVWGARSPRPLRLMALTTDSQSVFGGARNPEQATLLGLCRVIAAEYPTISSVNVDVLAPRADDVDRWVAQVLCEVDGAPGEAVVALRGGGRLVLRHEPCRLPAPTDSHPMLRDGGVYMITGGLGGMGLVLAERLGRLTHGTLILIGRHPDAVEDARLAAVKATGAKVIVRAADVCDLTQMHAVVAEARERFGAINGVVHAAGLTSGGVLQAMSVQGASAVLAPKVRGTLVLDEALAGEQLDFLVLCSSLTALLGGFGQGDYCAANCFLDAYAQQQRAIGRPVTSIDWDGWRDVGAAALQARREPGSAAGRGFATGAEYEQHLTPAEGADVFERALAADSAQLLVSTVDLATRRGRQGHEHPPGHRSDDAVSATSPGIPVPCGDHRVDVLTDIWVELLGAASVALDDDFFDLGGDSLLAVQVVYRMGSVLGRDLPGHLLIEHPTLGSVIRWLDAQSVEPDVQDDPRAHVVRLTAGTDGHEPMFFVHPAGGYVYFYRELARAVGPERAFYGIQMPAANGRPHNLDRIEDIAARYIAAVRTVSPEGPYLLGGSSFGGLVAFEMAQQLSALGSRVSLVAMIDSPAPAAGVPELGEDAEILGYLLSKGASGEAHEQLRRLTPDERLALFISHGGAEERISSHASAGDVQQFLDMFRANVRSMRRYEPLPYAGRVLYVQAQEADGVNAPEAGRHWRHLVSGEFELVTLAGTHITMNLPPNVAAMGALLRAHAAETISLSTDRS
jgi:thioesterase domain-containing protein/NADP-dependent 3-hydroxy acid dehydrogenase YdfG